MVQSNAGSQDKKMIIVKDLVFQERHELDIYKCASLTLYSCDGAMEKRMLVLHYASRGYLRND